MLRLQWMVESTPKAQRLVRIAHPTTWWDRAAKRLLQSTEWIAMAIVLVDSICETRLSTRVVQMQRRSKMLCLQRMVESTPKAGKSSIALPRRNQPQRLVRRGFLSQSLFIPLIAPYNVVGLSEWIMSAIVFVDSICESRLSIGVCKCSGGARGFAPTKDGGINPKGWCAVRTLHNVHRTYSIQSVG